ncbi:MAG TPA: hypothetical protein VLH39_08605, partial [Magnetospirillaceae bacterium]|nr:hypothetical protein [Magnetospirillaceae bacterium]
MRRPRQARHSLLLAVFAAAAGYAQNPVPPQENDAWTGAQGALVLDISGSGFYELVSWVRKLGLPETGGAGELRARLYAHYGLEPPETLLEGDSIRIESAERTEYFRLQAEGEQYVRLTG